MSRFKYKPIMRYMSQYVKPTVRMEPKPSTQPPSFAHSFFDGIGCGFGEDFFHTACKAVFSTTAPFTGRESFPSNSRTQLFKEEDD